MFSYSYRKETEPQINHDRYSRNLAWRAQILQQMLLIRLTIRRILIRMDLELYRGKPAGWVGGRVMSLL